MGYTDEFQAVVWTSPSGTAFTLKTLESGFSQKHVGEVKENPRTAHILKLVKAWIYNVNNAFHNGHRRRKNASCATNVAYFFKNFDRNRF